VEDCIHEENSEEEKSSVEKRMATKNYDLATNILGLVASWLVTEKVNFEP